MTKFICQNQEYGDYLTVSKSLIRGSAWWKTMNPVRIMVEHLQKTVKIRGKEVPGHKINDRKGSHTCQEARIE